MFFSCSSLTNLDIRNFNFTSVTVQASMFTSVPTSISITANAAGKTWLNTNFPTYTNIIVV